MISIIICSRGEDIPPKLRENIESTVGCDHELVVIDNSNNSYDIFQAYNEGVRRAHGDTLCFAHDDILFHTNNWGNIVQAHFNNRHDLGILGVAGSHFMSSYPIYWSLSPFISEHHLHNDNGEIIKCFNEDYFPEKESLAEVVAVDGLCFFMRKKSFSAVQFDENTYKGFHAYDMDICMQIISHGLKIMVCRDMVVEHAWSEKNSPQKPGMEMLDTNMRLFVSKWRTMLPIIRGIDLPSHTIYKLDQIYAYVYDSIRARHSKSYKIGHALLSPVKSVRKLLP